ncbi:MBL fold metallo-hydrolase [uncultured Brachyspira sp.]|uniref:MBL fold metallo-hydrolase n=1 Tax=uncultured Brachyspira sp. TaxID=221953 RepID=UPI0025E1C08C|nr:MBL fold metallo-hydrolase [uncultured Brachyspira sp.]
MKITFLGTGTSDGVPMIGCRCKVCVSKDKRDKRTRSSVLINHNSKNYVVDTSADFRQQMLREKACSIESVFYTHAHADHSSGIVDLRSLNFIMHKPVNCYGNKYTMDNLRDKYDYFFNPVQIGGGLPQVIFHYIENEMIFDDMKVIPIPVEHGMLHILGYRFNNFTYITDASFISKESLKLLEGTEILVLNALRYRPHYTHLSLQESVNIADRLSVKKAYFTHMTHDVLHRHLERELPSNMYPAYDGLTIEIN